MYGVSVIPDEVCRGGLAVAAELGDQVFLVEHIVVRDTLLINRDLGMHQEVLLAVDHHALFVNHVELVVDPVLYRLRPHLQVHRLSLRMAVHELLLLVLQFQLLLTQLLLLEQTVHHLSVRELLSQAGFVVVQFDHFGGRLSRNALFQLEGLVGLTVDVGLGLFVDIVDGEVVLDDVDLSLGVLLQTVDVVLFALFDVMREELLQFGDTGLLGADAFMDGGVTGVVRELDDAGLSLFQVGLGPALEVTDGGVRGI